MKRHAVAEIEAMRVQVAEEGRNQGYQDGLEQGRQEGFAQGHQDGLDSVSEAREHALAEVAAKAEKLEKEYERKVKELEPQFTDTLTGIYEHIFHVSLRGSRELIVYLIQNTMRNIEGGNTYLIHVSKEDYPYVNMKKNETLLSSVSANASVELVEDMTLGPNDCIIETDGGIFDCGLGTQLEELTQKLRLLSYRVD